MPVSANKAASSSAPPETEGGFAVYVHWPFCQSKCPYCDFNSHVTANVDQVRWGRALTRELRHMRDLTGPRRVRSVFFGGGTPSLMLPQTVDTVLQEIASLWSMEEGAEITLEANPTSVEAERFRGYRAAGVNRLSLGVQSLDDAELKFLGRLHTAKEALAAIALARETFPRLSFDLIYARPGQTRETWERELRAALAHAADHLSLYQLTIEPDTAFARLYEKGAFALPAEEDAAALYELTGEICAEAGMSAYEVSNYAKPGAECRHNLVYWRYGDYSGVGPGAHGRLTLGDGRWATDAERQPEAWLEGGPDRTRRVLLSREEQAAEMLMMGMRLAEGVDAERYARLAGAPLDAEAQAELAELGLIWRDGTRIGTTEAGRNVLDAVLKRLLIQ